jgi:hypothetical protein
LIRAKRRRLRRYRLPTSRWGAAVVSGVDAPPIFEPSEHVFDFAALLLEEGVIGDGDLPIGFRRDADGDAALCEGGAETNPRGSPCQP